MGGDLEERRLAVLYRTGALLSPCTGRFERICALACRLFQVPSATLSLIDERTVWHKAGIGIPVRAVARGGTLFDCLVQDRGLVTTDDPDGRSLDRFAMMLGLPRLRFVAATPVMLSGHVIGAVCVYDPEFRVLDDADRQAFALLGSLAQTEIRLTRSDQDLSLAGAPRTAEREPRPRCSLGTGQDRAA
jgi:sigma-B regulation protein RsbU (phosphoserine phosphatase)